MLSTTCDTYDDHADLAQVLVGDWRSYGGRAAFDGPAQTVRCFNDNTVVRSTLEQPGEGRVLVVDGAGSLTHALLGDQVAALALSNGWVGLVVNGAIRDRLAVGRLELGVLALGTVPRRSRKEGAGVVGVAVTIGGGTVRPGDRVVADADGVVVLPGGTVPGPA